MVTAGLGWPLTTHCISYLASVPAPTRGLSRTPNSHLTPGEVFDLFLRRLPALKTTPDIIGVVIIGTSVEKWKVRECSSKGLMPQTTTAI